MSNQNKPNAHRERRIIYNNDGGDAFLPGANTPDGFLSKRLTHILGTQVDSVFYCTGATAMFTHLAQVGEIYGEFIHDGMENPWQWIDLRDNIAALREAGFDTLELVIDFCHKNDLEIFWTYRINDIHDSFASCVAELARWKREHPEYCMGPPENAAKYDPNSPRYWWSSLDFERPEVLDYLYCILEDVCRRYDVDGIEIDYFRSPMFFRPNLDFQPATPAQVDILTGFQRRVRDLASREGGRRGRSILVSTRVPMTEAACRHVGIDVVGWLKEKLMDVLTTGGGYVPFTMPTAELVGLGHAHHVPVYPTISDTGLRNRGFGNYQSAEAWRGTAANAWNAGADGIVMFNVSANRQESPNDGVSLSGVAGTLDLLDQIGSPHTLVGLDKIFAIDNHPILEGCHVQAIEQSQILPMTVDPWGKPRGERLIIADDIPATENNGTLADVEMRIQLEEVRPDDTLEVRLNGIPLTPQDTDAGTGWLTFRPELASYRVGENNVQLRVLHRPSTDQNPIVVRAVEVHVKYR